MEAKRTVYSKDGNKGQLFDCRKGEQNGDAGIVVSPFLSNFTHSNDLPYV